MNISRFNQIKWKLTLVILGTSVVILGLVCIAVLVYDSVASKLHLLSRIETMADITAGYDGDPRIDVLFPKECHQSCGLDQIVESGIPFFALCEHHVLPFYGHAAVGYVRDDDIIGVSKLTRIVRLAARRFTQQERMGRDIADVLEAILRPAGVAVLVEGHHMCSQMRGVRDIESHMRTIVWRGAYQHNDALQRVFFDLARHAGRH